MTNELCHQGNNRGHTMKQIFITLLAVVVVITTMCSYAENGKKSYPA